MSIELLFKQPSHWVLCAPVKLHVDKHQKDSLSQAEQQRWQRFRKAEDQQRYLIAHVLKRFCLSRFLAIPPGQLTFSSSAKGKPYCEQPGAPQFNLSHSGDWVLMGLSTFGEIGVDVERLSRTVGESIHDYVLSSEQKEHVQSSLDSAEQFMIYWTQKEAVSKTLGLGLSMGLRTIHCNGQLGDSVLENGGSPLYLHTRKLDSQHLLSVASTSGTQLPDCYFFKAWNSEDCLVEKLL